MAHGIAYITLVGPVPCPHRGCVNPAHLEPVPHGENLRRGNTMIDATHC